MKHPGHTYGGFVPAISERGMTMWKDHIFWKALGPMPQQIGAEYEASEREVFSLRTLHDLSFNLSLNYLSPFAATRRSRT
jgi:hypothetical protein